jgi:hypothetical protein
MSIARLKHEPELDISQGVKVEILAIGRSLPASFLRRTESGDESRERSRSERDFRDW